MWSVKSIVNRVGSVVSDSQATESSCKQTMDVVDIKERDIREEINVYYKGQVNE